MRAKTKTPKERTLKQELIKNSLQITKHWIAQQALWTPKELREQRL